MATVLSIPKCFMTFKDFALMNDVFHSILVYSTYTSRKGRFCVMNFMSCPYGDEFAQPYAEMCGGTYSNTLL